MQGKLVRVSPEMIVAMVREMARVVLTSLVSAAILSALSYHQSRDDSLFGMTLYRLCLLRKSFVHRLGGMRAGKHDSRRSETDYINSIYQGRDDH